MFLPLSLKVMCGINVGIIELCARPGKVAFMSETTAVLEIVSPSWSCAFKRDIRQTSHPKEK